MHKCIYELRDQRRARLPIKPQSCHELQCGSTKKPRLFSDLYCAPPLAFLALLSSFLPFVFFFFPFFLFLPLQMFLILVQPRVGLSEVIFHILSAQQVNKPSRKEVICQRSRRKGVNMRIRGSECAIKVTYQKVWDIFTFLS